MKKAKKVSLLLFALVVLLFIDYAIVWPYLKTTFALFLTCVLAFSAPAIPIYLIFKALKGKDVSE